MKEIIPYKPIIGMVIGTYASIPYVHLGLEALRRHEPLVRVLVHDDCSPKADELRELCGAYGADFISLDYRHAPTVGDLSAFVEGLRWGKANGLDIVVKNSRRMIWNKPWVAGLQELAHCTQYATYTGACSWFGFGHRSECVAMHVPSWIDSGAFAMMEHTANANQPFASLPEAWHHWRARDVHKFVHPVVAEHMGPNGVHIADCDFVTRHESYYPVSGNCDGFQQWPALGLHRGQRIPGLLWHDSHSFSDYADLAAEFGLPYTTEDFVIIPGS